MKNKIFALIFACLTFFAIPVLAEEKIESFDSLIQVQTDGSMVVTETITVHHEGINIRRGIYRDLPTKKGEKYELIGVTRNGRHEPSFVERRSGYYRINTGDDNYLPHPGTSTFKIKYKVWNLPKSYEGYDEVYWNVTGDEWAFPIENVSAKMELPYGADIIQQASYIGYAGSTESAIYEGNGQYSGRYLRPGEQLTIAVGFTPGIVSTKKYTPLQNALRTVVPFIFYFVYLGFLIWAWHKKGRDPAGRVIMPQYEPPEELTAAQAACLYDKGVKKNIFAISLIQMISNGFLKLTTRGKDSFFSSGKEYILERTSKRSSNIEEDSIYWEKIELDGKYHKNLEQEGKKIQRIVEKEVEYYHTINRSWVLIPTYLMLFIFMICFTNGDLLSIFRETKGDIRVVVFLLLVPLFLTNICRTMFIQLGIYLGFWIFFCEMMIGLAQAYDDVPEHFLSMVFSVFITGLTSTIFTFLLYQPTEKGQRLIEHLEGLKMFLKATKMPARKRLEIEEKLSPENMEKMFPYALALGLEKEWEKRFKWYFGTNEYHHFVHVHPYMSASFTRSFSSSTSKSSGGSGGGGGAGGGGGGGGGGGR